MASGMFGTRPKEHTNAQFVGGLMDLIPPVGNRPALGFTKSQNAEGAREEDLIPGMPTKTPVSILQELCVKRQITPKYDLVQIEGSVHEPTFKYRVTVSDHVEHGTGQSKKKAKHAAAKAVLDKLIGSSQLMKNGEVEESGEVNPKLQLPYEDGIPGNPVGWLQEFCMANRLPPPIYKLAKEDGLPHERLFTIDCVIGKNRASGCGKSKKMAKRQAAHMLLQILQDNQGDAQGIAYDEDDEEVGPKAVPGVMPPGVNRFANLKDTKVSIHSLHSPKMLQSLKSLATAKGEKITNLKTTSLNTEGLDFVSFLLEIALEQKFDVTFVDLDEKSRHGKVQCLVQLSLQPVAVCFASGDTKLDAHNAAAQNALEYLKVMCK